MRVPWVSEGYVLHGELVKHRARPYVETGDAGRWAISSHGEKRLEVMQRLRPPIEVRRGALRLLVQPCEVEEAMLKANPRAVAAAALQGPHGQLYCALASPRADIGLVPIAGALQPDRVAQMEKLPTSPAGKVLYSKIIFD